MNHVTLAFTLLVVAIASSGCAALGGGKHIDVKAIDDQFQPNTLSIKQNQLVEWHNDGSREHTVTIHKGGEPLTTTKKDTQIAPNAATTFKFEETGTFHVYCKYHSTGSAGGFNNGMVMTVTVA